LGSGDGVGLTAVTGVEDGLGVRGGLLNDFIMATPAPCQMTITGQAPAMLADTEE